MESVTAWVDENVYEEIERREEEGEVDSKAEALRELVNKGLEFEGLEETEESSSGSIEDFLSEEALKELEWLVETGRQDDLESAASHLIEWAAYNKY